MNKRCILVIGESGTGKTLSLRNLPLEKILYINFDGKSEMGLGMEEKMKVVTPESPMDVINSLEAFEASDKYDYIVIDTLSFMADQYEAMYIHDSEDSRSEWGNYAHEITTLLNFARLKSKKTWIFFNHLQLNTSSTGTAAYVKGSLAKKSLESFFSTVLLTDTYDLAKPNPFGSVVGYRFQTKPTAQNRKVSARSPIGVFPEYIKNNDLDLVFRALDGEKIDWENDDVIFEKDKKLAKKLGI